MWGCKQEERREGLNMSRKRDSNDQEIGMGAMGYDMKIAANRREPQSPSSTS